MVELHNPPSDHPGQQSPLRDGCKCFEMSDKLEGQSQCEAQSASVKNRVPVSLFLWDESWELYGSNNYSGGQVDLPIPPSRLSHNGLSSLLFIIVAEVSEGNVF